MSFSLASIAKLTTRSVSLSFCFLLWKCICLWTLCLSVTFGAQKEPGLILVLTVYSVGYPSATATRPIFFFFFLPIKHAISLIPVNVSRRPLSFSCFTVFFPQWRRIILFLISLHATLHLSGAAKSALCVFSVAEYAVGDRTLDLMGTWT